MEQGMNGEAFELEFNHTVDTVGSKAKGWLVNYLSNTQDAEDVYSEAVKDLWKWGKDFDGDSSLATPFFRIVRRRAADFMRWKYRWGQMRCDEFVIPYFMAQRSFRINMLLHPLWRHQLDGDQVSLLEAIKKTLREETLREETLGGDNGTGFV